VHQLSDELNIKLAADTASKAPKNSQTRKIYCFSINFSRFYLEVMKRCFTFAPK
jgi:hypothetical protein